MSLKGVRGQMLGSSRMCCVHGAVWEIWELSLLGLLSAAEPGEPTRLPGDSDFMVPTWSQTLSEILQSWAVNSVLGFPIPELKVVLSFLRFVSARRCIV